MIDWSAQIFANRGFTALDHANVPQENRILLLFFNSFGLPTKRWKFMQIRCYYLSGSISVAL